MWVFPFYPYSLIGVSVAISALVIFFARRKARPSRPFVVGVVTFVVMYVLVVGSVWVFDGWLDEQMARFDIDDDGVISSNEKTPTYVEISERHSSDAGRSLAPFTGAGFSLLHALLTAGVYAVAFRRRSEVRRIR